MKVLLDTCVILWLASEVTKLSRRAKDVLNTSEIIYASSASAWEIGLKVSKGQLKLQEPLEHWWPAVLDQHNLFEIALDGKAACHSTSLPKLHKDPADRMLIAVAELNAFALLTPDPLIHQYSNLQAIW